MSMDLNNTPLGTISVLMDLSSISLSRLLVDCGEYAMRFTKTSYTGPNDAETGLVYLATDENGFEWEILITIHNNQIQAHIY